MSMKFKRGSRRNARAPLPVKASDYFPPGSGWNRYPESVPQTSRQHVTKPLSPHEHPTPAGKYSGEAMRR